MYFQVSVTKTFAGAHFLRQYKGKCENLHGHNWQVRACFGGQNLTDNGMLLDFTEIKKSLNEIIVLLDHKCLNDTPPFDKINPTAENIALFIFNALKKHETSNAKIVEVEVWESQNSSAKVSEEK
jgi:6-pyruvoyltetrahydropterin/6-carboxytetrahydropterin synthase